MPKVEEGGPVLMVAHSQYRGVYVGIARRLHVAFGCPIHLYTATEQEAAYYRSHYPDLFASVEAERALYTACREPIAEPTQVLAIARGNEEALGITYGELAITDRHLGRGYALGGFHHPRSRISENTDYHGLLNGYNRVIEFWNAALDTRLPVLLLNGGKVLCILARARGIPVRILAGSRYKNYYYWAVNEFLETGPIDPTQSNPHSPDLSSPYLSYVAYRKRFEKNTRLLPTLLRSQRMILRHFYWLLRRYDKAHGYYLRENLNYLWRHRRDTLRMTHPRLSTLEDIKGKRFVFFPLATEPESALQALSPEYFSQLTCIASISRDLPAGYMLVVKEHHTATGRRPTDFYQQIAEFKNVLFVNMSENGLAVVKEADAVVTISGTSGLEAAILGKPVIIFGRHNIYRDLPHVFTVTNESQLKGYLANALKSRQTPHRIDGERFLAALLAISFDMGNFIPWEPDQVGDAELNAAFDMLRWSIGTAEPWAVAEPIAEAVHPSA
jgi:hypothetical protein